MAVVSAYSEESRMKKGAGPLYRLGSEVASLRQQLADFRQQTETSVDQLRRNLEDLNRQLGN